MKPDVDTLTLDFAIHGVTGEVTVAMAANHAPEALGCDPSAQGFPVCEATVDTQLRGYRALLGWVQVVGLRRSPTEERRFVLDPLPVFDGVDTPFGFYGVHPVLFDAPSRRDRTQQLDWLAHSFLCASPAGPMEQLVKPYASFQWGFILDAGTIRFVRPEPLPLATWTNHQPLLETSFPAWQFLAL